MSTIIFGVNPVLEVLRASPHTVERIVIADGALNKSVSGEILERAKEAKVKVDRSDRERVNRLAEGGVHQGVIAEVRGKGLMLGIKMKVESRPFFLHLRDNHQLLTVAAGDNTLRLLPPLVIGDAEIDEFFDKLSAGAADYTVPDAA